jgi:nitrous oxidase accessory protein
MKGGATVGPARYLAGSFPAWSRRWIVVAALVLLPVFFLPVLPVWTMKLWAPQYPEGLTLVIYANTIRGDLDKINTLNHYVGMHPIRPDDFSEFSTMPQLLTFFGVMALLAALVNRRWIAIAGWLGFTAFAIVMFRDYANWLWHYGHDLDPRAALKLEAFTPPLIGFKKMANFRVWSLPGPGTLLLGFAWLLGPVVLALEHRAARRAKRAAAVAPLVPLIPLIPLIPLLLALAVAAPTTAHAATRVVPARPGAAAAAIAAAQPGDVILLATGVHRGPLRLDRAVTLRGEPGAVLDGGGRGTVLEIAASSAVVESLAIRGSGTRPTAIDSGIRVVGAADVTLRSVDVSDVLYGVSTERSDRLLVERSRFRGRVRPLDETGSGNGIHLWYTHEARLHDVTVERFADGIYLSFADRTQVEDARLQDNGRYGLHTMYCQESRLTRSLFTRNVAGCAIMFSNGLRVTSNRFLWNRGSRTYGLLLRDCSAGEFIGNTLAGNTVAMFLDNSNRNRIRGNLFQDNGWGMLLFSSCAGNETAENVFLQNDYPVALDMRRSDNRFDDGTRGNFWSENAPYDLDADGASDVPYSPVGAFAFLSKQYPDLSILARSPAVVALGMAERAFPALRPSEIVDRHPLVSPGAAGLSAADRLERSRSTSERPNGGALAAFGSLLAVSLLGIAPRGRAR